MACAAALANLEILEREKLVERVRDDVGPRFLALLRGLASHPAVAETRGFGLIGALELRRPPKGPHAAAAPGMLGPAVHYLAREEGVLVRGIRDLVAMSPPFVVTHAELERMFALLTRGARPDVGLKPTRVRLRSLRSGSALAARLADARLAVWLRGAAESEARCAPSRLGASLKGAPRRPDEAAGASGGIPWASSKAFTRSRRSPSSAAPPSSPRACSLLARRTGQEPERLLGAAIGCTAVLGYGVLIANLVLRGDTAPADVSALSVFLSGAGRILHDVGVTLFLVFVVRVFRPDEAWAKALAGGMLALLWGGVAGRRGERQPSATSSQRSGARAWWCEYAVIWTYSLWSMAESYRYWSAMRKRAAIGLADPVVANRFLLWGTASLFTSLATWTASIPFASSATSRPPRAITPAVRIVTALAGIGSVSCSLFAFLPPAWYTRRIEPLLTRGGAATSR